MWRQIDLFIYQPIQNMQGKLLDSEKEEFGEFTFEGNVIALAFLNPTKYPAALKSLAKKLPKGTLNRMAHSSTVITSNGICISVLVTFILSKK